jgi:hypothetical protein
VLIAERRITAFKAWCQQENYKHLYEITPEAMPLYRNTWPGNTSTLAHRQGTMYNFFRFCADLEVDSTQSGGETRSLHVDDPEVDYFASHEFDAFLRRPKECRGARRWA